MYRSLDLSVRGMCHKVWGSRCQDASVSFASPDGSLALALVADGHGHSQYARSDKGAQLAVDAGVETILEAYHYQRCCPSSMPLRPLTKGILYAMLMKSFLRKVGQDLNENPVTEEEERQLKGRTPLTLYGTTLLGSFQFNNHWYAFGMGDGAIYHAGPDYALTQVLTPPETEAPNVVCGSMIHPSEEEFRFVDGDGQLVGALLVTDGLVNSFSDGGEEACQQMADMLAAYHPSLYMQLRDFLDRVSDNGVGDDISVACYMLQTEEAQELWDAKDEAHSMDSAEDEEDGEDNEYDMDDEEDKDNDDMEDDVDDDTAENEPDKEDEEGQPDGNDVDDEEEVFPYRELTIPFKDVLHIFRRHPGSREEARFSKAMQAFCNHHAERDRADDSPGNEPAAGMEAKAQQPMAQEAYVPEEKDPLINPAGSAPSHSDDEQLYSRQHFRKVKEDYCKLARQRMKEAFLQATEMYIENECGGFIASKDDFEIAHRTAELILKLWKKGKEDLSVKDLENYSNFVVTVFDCMLHIGTKVD